jgi:hypothetical protein
MSLIDLSYSNEAKMNEEAIIMNTKISLPNEFELHRSLSTCTSGMRSFLEITKIDKILVGHSTLSPIEIIKIVDERIKYYNDWKHCRYRVGLWVPLNYDRRQEIRQKMLEVIFAKSPEVARLLPPSKSTTQAKL